MPATATATAMMTDDAEVPVAQLLTGSGWAVGHGEPIDRRTAFDLIASDIHLLHRVGAFDDDRQGRPARSGPARPADRSRHRRRRRVARWPALDGPTGAGEGLRVELVERDEQMAALSARLADTGPGAGRSVLVAGEAGIGKTGAARLWWGACDALSTPRSLGPLYDIARTARGSSRP